MTGEANISVTMATGDGRRRYAAEALAARLGAPCVAEESTDTRTGFRLRMLDDRLELADETMKPGTGVCADLVGELTRLVHQSLSRRDPLRRAVGKDRSLIVDATAGLGTDAVRLATLGEHVVAIERSPIVFALLEDGLRCAQMDDLWQRHIGDRLEIRHGDAATILETLQPQPDVVVLDPMHPPKRRSSALPRKQMQMLRRIAGDDDDAERLLRAARAASLHRVIVKRPDHAPPLAPDVTMSFPGKLVRLDVYVRVA